MGVEPATRDGSGALPWRPPWSGLDVLRAPAPPPLQQPCRRGRDGKGAGRRRAALGTWSRGRPRARLGRGPRGVEGSPGGTSWRFVLGCRPHAEGRIGGSSRWGREGKGVRGGKREASRSLNSLEKSIGATSRLCAAGVGGVGWRGRDGGDVGGGFCRNQVYARLPLAALPEGAALARLPRPDATGTPLHPTLHPATPRHAWRHDHPRQARPGPAWPLGWRPGHGPQLTLSSSATACPAVSKPGPGQSLHFEALRVHCSPLAKV